MREIRSSSSRNVVVKLKDLRFNWSPTKARLDEALGLGKIRDRKAWVGLARAPEDLGWQSLPVLR